MQATATSNINNKYNLINKIDKLIIFKLGAWDPNNVNNKCPATIFAANRIDNVNGRMIFLTDSIITIIGIKKLGVPIGTKWQKRLLYWNIIDKIILPNHKGKANVKVNDIWLVLVKIYGKSPIKLEKIIKKKSLIYKNIVPWIFNSPKIAINSFFKKKIIFKNDLDIWEFINQYIWGKKKILIKIEIQFNVNVNEKIFTEGSKEENKFII